MDEKKNIVLGVTGSIAAHKAVDICSQLTKGEADVHVVMTKDAMEFISPLPFKTLSHNRVITSLYDEDEAWQPAHIRLADEADLILVSPATANTIAKLANGLADDALSCIVLAANPEAKLVIAPALNGKMWQNDATQLNVQILKDRGVQFVGPEEGDLACGYEGLGRLSPVEKITGVALKAVGLDS